MVKGVVSSKDINGNKSKWSFLLVKTNADIELEFSQTMLLVYGLIALDEPPYNAHGLDTIN